MRLILLAFVICSVGAISIRRHKVPRIDGTFTYMTEHELKQIADDATQFYDPHTEVIYHLYTRENPIDSQILKTGDHFTLRNSNFNPRYPTIFIVHGWNADIRDGTIQGTRREYLAKGEYNIIGIDWSAGCKTPNYASARYRCAPTGYAISEFMLFLVRDGGANARDFLPMGFSLGGHVVGFIGRGMQSLLGFSLPALVALDPAGPLFEESIIPGDHLRSDDADYVEVVHTSGASLGYLKPLGDRDFYVNGGRSQNGCLVVDTGCSHTRAVALFIESINSKTPFLATKCASFDSMSKDGCEFLDEKVKMFNQPLEFGTGVFYVETNSKSPFAMG